MSIIDTLITDRTQADVDRVRILAALWVTLPDGTLQWTGTADELTEYMAGLKGSYNASDLNRVEGAVTYVAQRLKEFGYQITVQAGRTWTVTDEPTSAMVQPILSNVAALRAALAVPAGTPHVPPDMETMTYQEANDIEKILADIDHLLTNAAASFRHCGAAVCGGGGLLIL